MKNLSLILKKCKKQLRNYQVHWEPFYNAIEDRLLKNADEDKFISA